MDKKMTPMRALLVTFVSALLPVTAAQAQDYATQVFDQLQNDRMAAGIGDYQLQNYVIGMLWDDQSDYWTFTLEAGREYVITAACDRDCSDIDLYIRNANGAEMARDTAVDRNPVIYFSPNYTEDFTIEIKMYTCSTNPCYMGFGIFRS